MDNVEIKIVRLITGEDVIASYSENDQNNITLVNPFRIIYKILPTGRSFFMMPWLPSELIEIDEVNIYPDDIITIMIPNKMCLEYYNNLLLELEQIKKMTQTQNELSDEEILNELSVLLEENSKKNTIH